MDNFKNRKFLLILMLVSGLFFCRVLFSDLGMGYISIISSVAALVFFALGGGFTKKLASAVFAVCLAIAAALSVFYGTVILARSEKALSYATGEGFEVTARVTEVRFASAYASSYLVEVTDVGGEEVRFGAVLETEGGALLEPHDIISFEAVFSEAEEEKAYLRAKNIFVCAEADDAARIGKAEEGFLQKFRKANEYMSARFEALMGKEAGGICSALILGNKSLVGAGTKLDFSRAGISHLLALSGLHLSVISGALDFILRGFAKKKVRGVILIISCFVFALFTGLSASVLRAAVMLAFVYAADIFGEENDSLTALFTAAWVILLVNGNAAYDVGFLLSFTATLGIILTGPAFEGLFAKWQVPRKKVFLRFLRSCVKYFYGIFAMSTAAFVFTLPIMGYTFGETSLMSLPANFAFLPLATVLIICCVLFIPLSYIPVLSAAISAVCKFIAGMILMLAGSISDIRGVTVSLRYPFMPYLLALLFAALVACIFIKKLSLLKLGVVALAFSVAFVASFSVYALKTNGNMLVRLGSGKSGEFVAIEAAGESFVFDISTGGYSFTREAFESREYFCRTEIDNFVITHYHIHHSSTLERLCDTVKIRRVLLPLPETEEEEKNSKYITESLSRNGMEYEFYRRGDVYESGALKISFAPMLKLSRSEKPMVAFSVRFDGASFSYIEGAALESNFDYSEHLSCEVVFVGAHGPARKFGVYAQAFEGAERVIFAEGARELFRGTEYLSCAYDIADYGGEMKILYE